MGHMGTQGDSRRLPFGFLGLRGLQGTATGLMQTQGDSSGLKDGIWGLKGTPGDCHGAY